LANISVRRERILKRDRYRCVYCNAAPPEHELTLDHVEPRVKGGDQSDGNLVACCQACNELKAGRAAWAFLATDKERRETFLKNASGVWPRIKRAIEEAALKAPKL
jgi:5-methylcytosine-specific restriction endonuclease McrA